MIDPATFFKALGIAIVIILLFGGVFYWIYFFTRKYAPDLKYWIKYKILRKKHDEKNVEKLLQYYDAKMSEADIEKLLLLAGFSLDYTREMLFVYKELKRLKGGSLK